MPLRPKASGIGGALSAIGALVVAAGFASIPFLYTTQSQNRLTDKKSALVGSQIQRGAFLNSGSKDVGIDPNWDHATGTYKTAGTAFAPSDQDIAQFRKQHGMRDPLEIEAELKRRRRHAALEAEETSDRTD